MLPRSLGVAALVVLASCGDDGAPPAGTADGSGRDGGGDSGPRPDGGQPGCTVEAPIELARDDAGGAIDVAAAGGPDAFLITWTSADGTSAVVIPTEGAPGAPLSLVAAGSEPTAVWAGDRWLAVWVGAGELHLGTIAADGTELASTAELTSDAIDDRAPALVAAPGADLIAAWIRGDEPVVARAGADGTLAWGPTALGTDVATDIAVAAIGEGDFFAAWAAPPAARARLFGHAGTLRGEPITLDPDRTAGDELAAAGGPLAGGVLFESITSGSRDDLRLQAIGAEGVLNGPSHLATIDGLPGREASLVRFAGGFAGAWRGARVGTVHARVGLFAVEGDPIQQTVLGSLARFDGPIAVAVATDGTLLVAWADPGPDGATVVAFARVACRG